MSRFDDPRLNELYEGATAIVRRMPHMDWDGFGVVLAHPSATNLIRHMREQGASMVNGHALMVVETQRFLDLGVVLTPGQAYVMLSAGEASVVVGIDPPWRLH